MKNWGATSLSLLVIVALWCALTMSGSVSDLFLPGPDLLWSAATDLVEEGYKGRSLWEHVADSLFRVLAGLGTGVAAGTLLGLAIGYVPILDALCAPFVEFLRPLPQLAYLVLLIVWLGIGETSKVTLLFLAALPVAAVAARSGVKNVSIVRPRRPAISGIMLSNICLMPANYSASSCSTRRSCLKRFATASRS